MRPLVMGVTGASGAAYARRLAQCLVDQEVELHLVVSPPAQLIMTDELGLNEFLLEAFLGRPAASITLHSYHDVGAVIASGSFLTAGMVICPCSSNSLGAIANGLGNNLITRAATVTLKEARRLVLVPRETPLHLGHLRLLVRVAEVGAVVMPPMPAFYHRPETVGEVVDQTVNRIVDLFGIELDEDLVPRWSGPPA